MSNILEQREKVLETIIEIGQRQEKDGRVLIAVFLPAVVEKL